MKSEPKGTEGPYLHGHSEVTVRVISSDDAESSHAYLCSGSNLQCPFLAVLPQKYTIKPRSFSTFTGSHLKLKTSVCFVECLQSTTRKSASLLTPGQESFPRSCHFLSSLKSRKNNSLCAIWQIPVNDLKPQQADRSWALFSPSPSCEQPWNSLKHETCQSVLGTSTLHLHYFRKTTSVIFQYNFV